MKIWLINQYNMPPEYGHLNRHYNFGKYLKIMGHEPTVFVGSYLHNTDIQMINDNAILKRYDKADFPYYFIKTCNYSSGFTKRVYTMFEFIFNLYKATINFERPDVIIGSSTHPLAVYAAIRLGKRYKVPVIAEIRDLWPESFIAYGIIGKKNPILAFLYLGEKWMYKKADKLIFTMEGGKDYIEEKCWDKSHGGPIDLGKIYNINNGVDLEKFNYDKETYRLSDESLDDEKVFKIIYTGSIRLVNNLLTIIKVAKILSEKKVDDVRFIFFGEGNEKESLEEYCRVNNIGNVVFKGHVDKKYIPYILTKSDLNIIHFDQNNVKKYGVSLNKMFEYFACGRPVFSDCDFGYNLITRYNCGFVIDNATAEDITNEILKIKEMDSDKYREICDNSLKAAKDYDFAVLTKKLVEVITDN